MTVLTTRDLEQELYDVQAERERPKTLAARERELKKKIADAVEGRRAAEQLAEAELARTVEEYGPKLTDAITAFRGYVQALSALNTASAERDAAVRRARSLDLPIGPEAHDSFATRVREDAELSSFNRLTAQVVLAAGWPR